MYGEGSVEVFLIGCGVPETMLSFCYANVFDLEYGSEPEISRSGFRRGEGVLEAGKSPFGDYKYRQLQGTYPVISLSFANVKEASFSNARKKICQIIKNLYNSCDYLLDGDYLNEDEKDSFRKVSVEMENYLATDSLNALPSFLSRYYGKRSSFFWMSMTRRCRKPMCMAIGGSWRHLSERCSMRLLRRILIWSGQS